MARTDQRSIPTILIAIVIVLLTARIGSRLMERPRANAGLVKWVSIQEGARLASMTGKPLLLDFTADWCAPCHLLDEQVFRNPELAADINRRFIAVRITDRKREDGRNLPEVAQLQQRYAVRGFPTVVFVEANGNEQARMEGFPGREEFERVMETVR